MNRVPMQNEGAIKKPTLRCVRKAQPSANLGNQLSMNVKNQFREGWAAIYLEVSEDDLQWLQGCLIGEVKDLETLVHIYRIFQSEQLEDLVIKYLGDLRMLVDCGSLMKSTKLLKQKSQWLLQWFKW